MTKSEIVKEISARTGIDSKAVLAVVEGFMTCLLYTSFGSMKTKRTVFEVNDVYRVMENSELIYTLTNSEKLKREEYKYEQMDDLLPEIPVSAYTMEQIMNKKPKRIRHGK